MSSRDDTGEKSEKPTPKRLRDARRDGDVPKSRDLSQTATTLVWMLLLAGLGGLFADRLGGLLDYAWTRVDLDSPDALRDVGAAAVKALLLLTVLPLGIASLCGILVEFLQVGAVFAPKRIAPDGSRLSPANGLQRVFSLDNVFEIAKSIFKTLLLATLIYLLIRHYLPDILELPAAGLSAYVGLDRRLMLMLCGFIVALFAFVSIADRLYQNYAHKKRLRMSKSEVKREHKQEEGDPLLRGQRRRLHRQWSSQDARQAAREATAVVVNPTHIAIAILYNPETTPVPLITAKGEGNLALLMRREAEGAGVPVIRDVPLARALNFHGEEDDFIPEEFFDAVAAVIASAERARGATQSGAMD
jgi:type III secretion protein U